MGGEEKQVEHRELESSENTLHATIMVVNAIPHAPKLLTYDAKNDLTCKPRADFGGDDGSACFARCDKGTV